MDFRLKVLLYFAFIYVVAGFNPCSNGLSAQRRIESLASQPKGIVSILVLMDFRLKGSGKQGTGGG